MEWSKLKNIILIILAAVNLTLLSFVLRREIQTRELERQARSDAILFLQNNGVSVPESVVPKRVTLCRQSVERDREQEKQLACALLGSDVEEDSWGGEVFRYYSQAGSIQFHSDGVFQGEFSPGAFPLGEQTPAAHARQVLSQLNFQGQVLEAEGDGQEQTAVTLRQTWNEVPVFGLQVTLNYRGGELISMTAGRRLPGQPVEDAGRAPISVTTGLIRFFSGLSELGDVCSRIDAITEGYSLSTTLSGPVVLVPVWHIATDTGTYQLDLITGALTRAAG